MGSSADTTVRRSHRAPPEVRTASVRVLFMPAFQEPGPPLPLSHGITTVGRDVEAGISLADDPLVSRVHAEIRVGSELRIVDKSTNGTFVNGRRVEETRLGNGDVVRIGDSFLHIRRALDPEANEPPIAGLLGDAPAMHSLRRTIHLIGPSEASVLIVGESGTGKELVSRALYEMGTRRGRFVAVNCSAIPETLAESHLFGHVAGAFTGARSDHSGYFRAADGGVLLLDEIGELSAGLQAKLLRALEEGVVTPVGSTRPVPCDVRVVAATNRDLRSEVNANNFRGDLYARLAGMTIKTPPLRDRREDILPLLRHEMGKRNPPLSPDLIDALLLYRWPFNVRELFQIGRELVIRGAGLPLLEVDLIQDRLQLDRAGATAIRGTGKSAPATAHPERHVPTHEELIELLREHRGVVADVARATGRSRKQVYRWMQSYGLDLESFRESGSS